MIKFNNSQNLINDSTEGIDFHLAQDEIVTELMLLPLNSHI